MKILKRALLGLLLIVLLAAVGFFFRPVAYFNGWMYARAAMSGVESSTVVVNGDRLHVNALGPKNGAPVVLVHGLGGRAEDWRSLAPYLAAAGYRVYMPDLPGYGRSDRPANFSYSVRDEAAVVVGFLDAMGLRQVDLGGWSMGGGIAQHVAFRHAERVRKLILFDAAGIYEMPRWDVRLFTPTSAAELDQLDKLLMPAPPQVPGFIARDILRVSHENAWIIHRALDSMLTGQDATDRMLPELKMPVEIVWGSLDQITPVSQAERMHQLAPQSELEMIAGCGHLAPGQCADHIGPRVVEFLQAGTK